jgi:hypothetical protein
MLGIKNELQGKWDRMRHTFSRSGIGVVGWFVNNIDGGRIGVNDSGIESDACFREIDGTVNGRNVGGRE